MSEQNERIDKLKMLGQHLIADFFGVENSKLKDPDAILKSLKDSATAANLAPSGEPLLVRFGKENSTGCLFLKDASARLSFSAYPEDNYIAIDLFIGDGSDPEKIFPLLVDLFSPLMVRKTVLSRGLQS